MRDEALPRLVLCALTFVFALAFFPAWALAHTQSSHTGSRTRSFLPQQTHRFQGALLTAKRIRSYKDFNLRNVPTNRLYKDLLKLDRTIRKYASLIRPTRASLVGPIVLIVVSCITLVGSLSLLMVGTIASVFAGNLHPFLLAGLVVLSVGIAGLMIGIAWLMGPLRKRRSSPYYRKIQQLKHVQKAIIIELRSRRFFQQNRYGLHLPPVHAQGLTLAF